MVLGARQLPADDALDLREAHRDARGALLAQEIPERSIFGGHGLPCV
jgi:hypothetical protein